MSKSLLLPPIKRVEPFIIGGRHAPFVKQRLQEIEFSQELTLPFSNVLWPPFEGGVATFSMVAKERDGLAMFFYEMLSKSLAPGQTLKLNAYSSLSFDLNGEPFLLLEGAILLREGDLSSFQRGWLAIGKELERGVVNLAQGGKDKNIANRFLLDVCGNFPSHHQKRVIEAFEALFAKLKGHDNSGRFIGVNPFKANYLDEIKTAFALGVSFSSSAEIFDLAQLKRLAALIGLEGSDFFEFELKEDRAKFFYFEIDGYDPDEVKRLKLVLARAINRSVQKLVRPLFMPRNEEEVMKNIVSLSRQIQYTRDIPQVAIHFDGQTEESIVFRALMVRVLSKCAPPIEEVQRHLEGKYGAVLDMSRSAGMVRRKVPKEASIFMFTLNASDYLRVDNTLDLYKARYEVYRALVDLLGDVRDFNGGLLAKQRERLEQIKLILGDRQKELQLENFYFSLYPVEYRTVWSEEMVLQFFAAYLQWEEEGLSHESGRFRWVKSEKEEELFMEELPAIERPSADVIRLKTGLGGERLVGIWLKTFDL